MPNSRQAVNSQREKNIVAIHEMMYSVVKKYSDVSIHVGDSVFKSNRWALAAFSEYFDAQFERWTGNQEGDENSQLFTLHEVDAGSFEKILEFMNSGQIEISDSNVYALLRASDYLLLRNNLIQEECISYLKMAAEKPEPILNALEVLEFSHLKTNQILMNILSPHILKHMDHFLKVPIFKEMSFDCLNSILKCTAGVGLERDYVLLQAVNTWIDQSRVERKEHRQELMTNIKADNISASDYLSLINHYENSFDSIATEASASGTRSDLHVVYPNASSSTHSAVNGRKNNLQKEYCMFSNEYCPACGGDLLVIKNISQYVCQNCPGGSTGLWRS